MILKHRYKHVLKIYYFYNCIIYYNDQAIMQKQLVIYYHLCTKINKSLIIWFMKFN